MLELAPAQLVEVIVHSIILPSRIHRAGSELPIRSPSPLEPAKYHIRRSWTVETWDTSLTEADVVVSDVVNSSALSGGKTRRRRVAAADRPNAVQRAPKSAIVTATRDDHLIRREGQTPCQWRPALVRQWILIGSTRPRMAVLLYGAAVRLSAQRASALFYPVPSLGERPRQYLAGWPPRPSARFGLTPIAARALALRPRGSPRSFSGSLGLVPNSSVTATHDLDRLSRLWNSCHVSKCRQASEGKSP